MLFAPWLLLYAPLLPAWLFTFSTLGDKMNRLLSHFFAVGFVFHLYWTLLSRESLFQRVKRVVQPRTTMILSIACHQALVTYFLWITTFWLITIADYVPPHRLRSLSTNIWPGAKSHWLFQVGHRPENATFLTSLRCNVSASNVETTMTTKTMTMTSTTTLTWKDTMLRHLDVASSFGSTQFCPMD